MVEGHRYYPEDFIRPHFLKFEGKLALNSLGRPLLLLGDCFDLRVTGLFSQGAIHGVSDLMLSVTDHRPLYITLDYNNFGSKFVSRDRYGLGLEMGNIVTPGSLLSLRVVVGSRVKNLVYGRGSLTLPYGYNGTRVQLVYTDGNFDLGQLFQ